MPVIMLGDFFQENIRDYACSSESFSNFAYSEHGWGTCLCSSLPDNITTMNLTLHKKTFGELTTDELYELLRVRSEVFVVEQNCVYQDLDRDDQQAIHLWMTIDNKVVAMARVCPAGTHMKEISIGRVITTERGKGYGKEIMLRAIDAAVEHFGATRIDIEAQEYAKGFYEGVGFRQSSQTFMLDGIPHIRMTWER